MSKNLYISFVFATQHSGKGRYTVLKFHSSLSHPPSKHTALRKRSLYSFKISFIFVTSSLQAHNTQEKVTIQFYNFIRLCHTALRKRSLYSFKISFVFATQHSGKGHYSVLKFHSSLPHSTQEKVAIQFYNFIRLCHTTLRKRSLFSFKISFVFATQHSGKGHYTVLQFHSSLPHNTQEKVAIQFYNFIHLCHTALRKRSLYSFTILFIFVTQHSGKGHYTVLQFHSSLPHNTQEKVAIQFHIFIHLCHIGPVCKLKVSSISFFYLTSLFLLFHVMFSAHHQPCQIMLPLSQARSIPLQLHLFTANIRPTCQGYTPLTLHVLFLHSISPVSA
ncbi:uncharacterized protein LOC126988234 isoform X3 [Eriocheir sinensis]|uniref:uncharacterized protein LOC126988234 isoform X3 n=1 Tax=Eriocheir sinensis TaxID=95602 RepID=UPI0021C71AFF|nr:uncharacterized protein LOC126988234 isoform X3 [Eriocheir sinensis]